MKAMNYQPLRGDVIARIRERIVDGTYAAGSRLVERTIAADLEVSRVPVREALHTLVREGFAVERDTGGIAVRAYDDAEIDELFDVRAALEGLLVEQLTGRSSDLEPLREILDEARRLLDAGDQTGAIAANAAFHEVIASLGHGPLVRQLLADLHQRMRWLLRQHTDPATIHAEHWELFTAMESGETADALRVNERHLRTSRQALDETRTG